MTKWKQVFKANYAQMSFVFLAFALIVLIGCISVGNAVQKGILSTVTVALDESEKTIRAYLREPRIAFDNIYMAVIGMLDKGEAREAIYDYLAQTTDSLRKQTDGVLGFNGVYGFIGGEFIDSAGLNPDKDFIPQQSLWYQLAIRNTSAEYTAPYTDSQTGHVIMSLAQELYGVNGDYYGVLALDVDITWMLEYAESLQFVEGGYGMIVSQYNYTVAHPLEECRGIPLQDLGKDYAEITNILQANNEIYAKRIKDCDGSNVIVYFQQLYNGWYIGVVMPTNSYYADLYFTAFALIVPGTILMLTLNFILLRLSAAKMRSEEESKAKSSFLARMSHEIRTPMNAILGMVELLLRKDLPGDAREEAASIKHAGVNLLSIINDILDVSKIESGRMELITADYYLASLLNDVINIIRVRISETPLVFTTDIDNNLPAVLSGDEVRLRQILLNLLSNAVKYTRKGSVSLTVNGEIINGDNVLLTFTVADTGIGIKEADLDKLFGDFTQFDTHRNMGIEGTGLGLAISRNLCRLMGGDITASSRYGEGSVFTAVLPQKIVNSESLKMEEVGRQMETYNPGTGFVAPTARLLIVDDIATNLKVAKGLLSIYKAKTDCCLSAREAIELLLKNEYDIVFMDHMMPEMDGVEAVKMIRAMRSARFQRQPIIALTANAISGMKEMFLESGFSDYLAKPIEMSKLNEIMDKWVPREKRVIIDEAQEPPSGSDTNAFEEKPLEIEGLDVKRGLLLTGGSEQRYLDVLSLYCNDVESRMDILKTLPEESTLLLFVTQVHALKSSTQGIGAADLANKAAFLEKAGLNGDIDEVEDKLTEFRNDIIKLTENIKKVLELRKTAKSSEESCTISSEELNMLKEALEDEKIAVINDLLEDLMRKNLDECFKNKLDSISDYILISEFKNAAQLIEDLLRKGGDE